MRTKSGAKASRVAARSPRRAAARARSPAAVARFPGLPSPSRYHSSSSSTARAQVVDLEDLGARREALARHLVHAEVEHRVARVGNDGPARETQQLTPDRDGIVGDRHETRSCGTLDVGEELVRVVRGRRDPSPPAVDVRQRGAHQLTKIIDLSGREELAEPVEMTARHVVERAGGAARDAFRPGPLVEQRAGLVPLLDEEGVVLDDEPGAVQDLHDRERPQVLATVLGRSPVREVREADATRGEDPRRAQHDIDLLVESSVVLDQTGRVGAAHPQRRVIDLLVPGGM